MCQNQENNPPENPKPTIENSISGLGVPQIPIAPNSPIYCVAIVGQIEGHMILPPQNKTTKYEHVIPQLLAIEQNPDIQGFVLMMNTVGGDVEAGLAIAEMVTSMTKPSVSLVLGGGHSIGVAMAVSTNYSFITPTATMTVHPIRMTGMIISVPQTYDYFNKMQERVVSFVVEHSHTTREKFMELMMSTGDMANDVGTVLVGEEAVNAGIIDAVGGLSDAMAKLEAIIGGDSA